MKKLFVFSKWTSGMRGLGMVRSGLLLVASLVPFGAAVAQTTVPLSQVPVLAAKSAPGVVMLNMSRDHRLFYAAYNDTSDLDGDGVIDVGFKPSITYYGYFDSGRCYKYDATLTPKRFVPVAVANATTGCFSTSGRWHGNWLNWALTSRMDALRKVLYGGYRITDTGTTVLEAANIPGDSHVWGKEYRPTQVTSFTGFNTSTEANARTSRSTATPVYGPAVDAGYDITQYTELPAPANGKMHIILVKSEGDANTVYTGRQVPTLRIQKNVDAMIDRVWIWSSSERPIGGSNGNFQFQRPGGCFTSAGLPGVTSCPGTATTFATYVPLTNLYPLANPVLSTTKYAALNYSTAAANLFTAEVRVETCVALSGVRESNCKGYPASAPTAYKPTGLLHDYGEIDSLKFGLLTGSYLNNYSGGVVRKDIGSFKDEVDLATGRFSSVVGIVKSIDRIITYGFDGVSNYVYDCGFNFTSLRTQGQCQMWGAPIGEMMYEGLRYFANAGSTPAFTTGVSAATSPDTRLGLPLVSTWANPFRPKASGGSPICSRPVQMVIADPITSFDSDQLPGAAFPLAPGNGAALPGGTVKLNGTSILDVSAQATDIWNKEKLTPPAPAPVGTLVGSSNKFFMGQTTLSNFDGNPTGKTATTFATMRGHGPDETNSQGSYYAASVAKYGHEEGVKVTDGTGSATGTKVVGVDTVSVALGSTIPRIQLSYAGKTATLVPFSKSVGGNGINPALGQFQITGLITLLYIDSIYNTAAANANAAINGGRPYIRFMVSFSDSDQGTDNEADANVYYTLSIDATGKLVVLIENYYQAGSIQQNMGYIISGTTDDGVYLEIGDESPANPIYYLDTLPGQSPAPPTGRVPANTTHLPYTATRTFTLGVGAGGEFVPKDPLWYAAKYGATASYANGDPTNYFKVTNAANLPGQMGKAFRSAAALANVASTSVAGVGQRTAGTAAIYEANFDSLTWTSRLKAFPISIAGVLSNTPVWEVSSLIPTTPAARTKLFLGRGAATTPVALASTAYASLTAAEKTDFGNAATYAYLLGDKTGEERNGGGFRNRGSTATTDTSTAALTASTYGSVMGDIVNSDPQIINKKDYDYAASDATYTAFLSGIVSDSLAVGSNDGFFHIFDANPLATPAGGGSELLAFMPQAARSNIKKLADPAYQHQSYVDGPIGLGHAKITVLGDATVNWRSIAIGTGGAGAQTVFAVNIPSNTVSTPFSANSILWEINQSSSGVGTTLGNIMGRPVIGKLPNSNTWVAIFGNGYNSTAGTANLYVVKLSDGSILQVINTNTAVTNNGMGSVQIVRKTSGNRDTIDYVYGSDFKGNIWRFDLSGLNGGMTNWPANAALVYTTPTGRPITAEIKIGDAPVSSNTTGGKMIYFGTGSLVASTDPADTTTQALYGIYDNLLHNLNSTPYVAESALVSFPITMAAGADKRTIGTAATPVWYNVTGGTSINPAKKGWVVPLSGTNVVAGERVIAPPVRFTLPGVLDAFMFTSVVPSTDDCIAGLDTWITGIDAMKGGYAKVFDAIAEDSVRVQGGSPRGVFVLTDSISPTLYISQTIFDNTVPPPGTSYATGTGGQQTVCINNQCGDTRIISIDLTKPPIPTPATLLKSPTQVWRQLK